MKSKKHFLLFLILTFMLPAVHGRDRIYLAQKLWSIFSDKQMSNPQRTFNQTIKLILERPDLFGGSCDSYVSDQITLKQEFGVYLNHDKNWGDCPPYIKKGALSSKLFPRPYDLRTVSIMNRICATFLFDDEQKPSTHYLSFLKRHHLDTIKSTDKKISAIGDIFFPGKSIQWAVSKKDTEKTNIHNLVYKLCRSTNDLL